MQDGMLHGPIQGQGGQKLRFQPLSPPVCM